MKKMDKNLKIAVVPIDNRPICYDIIKDVLAIDKKIKLFLPPIKYLGGLKTNSSVNGIFEFLENLKEVDYLILSLDTIAYGGLISSRRCEDDLDEIKKRIDKLKEIILKTGAKVLAFSSIMRISNNNINEEEKVYWKDWGKKIFDWSFEFHKTGYEPKTSIPKEILKDYKKTRKRNFEINKYYLKLAKDGIFDTLIFSKDDCSEFGLNVLEAKKLENLIGKNNNILIKTGADEIPLSLISRALTKEKTIKINPLFLEDKSTDLISKYEDISIKNCTLAQIALAGCLIDTDCDLTLLINNFKKEQGDLVLGTTINSIKKKVKFPSKPYFIADVNNANGADCKLVEEIFKEKIYNFHGDNFYGYCAYNTSANTIGASIFCAIVKYLALKKGSYNNLAFQKIQFIRFLDDWGYQAISRKFVRESSPKFIEALIQKEEELNLNSQKISKFLNYYPKEIKYSLPWKRSFEIRIKPVY